ncbi:iron complex outermembrane recepter protein [Halopseudomonas sabulinigri]|uniref:Iron complex outermembrane recepter protein n=1 Tax=Halopseudomonas sabulinigri TaxID=472181 RepID=A0A1H1M4V2_9GAMM|nr:TonB-dependent receptor [Halopseudomonas sabulinigri]SDR81727.1 iron complex outermembrane recepter protein [Halopseudomonas sabulinigri]
MPHPLSPPNRLVPLCLACLLASPAQAQEAVQLEAMTISGEKLDAVAQAREQLHDVPGGTNLIDMQQVEQGRVAGVADVLAYQPGVYAQSPGNEGVKISIRGSGINRGPGAHASGNHIMLDGLPLTGSGGTPYELLEPLWLSRAEVLRGANGFDRGALALGGAVDYITRSGFDAPRLQLRMEAGSDGYLKRHIASGQVIDNLDYYLGVTDLHYDGQQDHAAGSGKGVVANLGLQLNPDLETRFFLRYRETEHQSPGRLTQSQIDDDPTQASAANIARDAKREQPGSTWLANKTTLRLDDVSTLEMGLVYHHYPMDLMESPYRIRVDYSDVSATLNYRREHQLFGLNSNTTVGWRTTTNLPSSDAKETAYQPLNASGTVYPVGTLMRKYTHQGSDNVLHISNELELAQNLWLTSGLALIYTEREVEVTWPDAGEKLNEGTWDYAPRLGLRYRLDSGSELYGNLSRSVEPPHPWSMIWGSPTRFPISNQPWSNRQSAPVSLDNQTATTFEVGARGDSLIGLWDLAYYYAQVRHELLTIEIEPNIFAESNASPTVHQGLEVGLTSQLWQGGDLGALALRQAYTFSDFHYRDDDTFGGNRLPGLPRHYYQGELRYQHPAGVYVGLNVEHASRVPVDYANSWYADDYTTFGAILGYEAPRQDWQAWLELRNLTDERYAATVTPGYNDNGVEAARLTPGESFGVYTGFSWSWL